MTNQVLFKDEEKINKVLSHLDKIVQVGNKVVETFNLPNNEGLKDTLGFGSNPDRNVTKPKAFLKKLNKGGAGLNIPVKGNDNDFDKEAASRFEKSNQVYDFHKHALVFWEYIAEALNVINYFPFDYLKLDVITLSENEEEITGLSVNESKVRESFTRYCENQRQVDFLNATKAFIEAAQDRKSIGRWGDNSSPFLTEGIKTNGQNFAIDSEYIASLEDY